jgi:hypothetical protein
MRALLVLGFLLVCVAADAAPPVRTTAGEQTESLAPSDVRVEVKKGEAGRWNVIFRRKGYLVALRSGERTSAARDSVTTEIDAPADSPIELRWEATDRTTLETDRGGIRVTAGESAPMASWFALPPPVAAGSNRHQLHDCRAFESESNVFAVVCRFESGTTQLSALNLTGDAPLAGVTTAPGPTPSASLVRLDLPISEGSAEARLVGYLAGTTAVVVRAEATWVRGEDRPTLLLTDGTRRQLVVTSLMSRPRWRKWPQPDFDFRF